MKISIIHPSRGRAQIAKQVIENWLQKSSGQTCIEYILSLDNNDPMKGAYKSIIPRKFLLFSDNHSAIEAINNAAKVAKGDLLIVVSDDFSCPEHWDTQLLKYLKDKSDFVVKTYDGLQPWIITLPIMDRVYYERFGYIYHPEYKHMFCDTEMTHVGDLLGKTIEIPMIFNHRHYSQPGGITKDAISVKNDSTWNQGEKLYLERMMRNFDLPPEDIKGHLKCGEEHVKWLQSKGVIIEHV